MDPTRVTRRSAAIALAISLTGGLLAVLVMVLGGAKPAGAAASPYCTALAPSGGSELLIARYAAVAAPLPNGQVLIAGGKSGSTFLASAELFSPTRAALLTIPDPTLPAGNTVSPSTITGAISTALTRVPAVLAYDPTVVVSRIWMSVPGGACRMGREFISKNRNGRMSMERYEVV